MAVLQGRTLPGPSLHGVSAVVKNETMRRRTNVCGQEHLEERCHEVIDPLHVPARRMPDGPHVQDPFQTLSDTHKVSMNSSEGEARGTTHPLRRCVHPKRHTGSCPRHINLNLMPDLLVKPVLIARERQLDQREVFLAFPGQGRRAHGGRQREVSLCANMSGWMYSHERRFGVRVAKAML